MEHVTTAPLCGKTFDREKLARICGLFGSDQLGERAAAAAMADKIVKQSGLSWFDVLSRTAAAQSCSTVEDLIRYALNREDELDAWQYGFICGIRDRQFLTSKQLAKLQSIVARLREDGRAAA